MRSQVKTAFVVWAGCCSLLAIGSGCAPERPQSVPPDARSVAKQDGTRPLTLTAPREGEVYVYDRSTSHMVYHGRLLQGETLEVRPKDDKVMVDGRVVCESNLRDLNEYQIWFDDTLPAGARQAAEGGGRQQ